ncbi:MAG: tyrosine-type recombinase/integrase [Fischerella sp.]|jgi:integrase/recombinase XerD|uniref:tyrosine-type recombinase/integrase n=1 Tax=Fischerella sp. TaxID=1191 RepID=UPI0017BE8B5A|nr:tyrosine-type recombinase/integrase [Fischerella sp.]NWF58115.1 tyrosine-type recombinase/integrase [Fischerella sp.]
MKNNRNGQSAILNDADYSKIRKQIKNRKYKLLLDLAWYTGERWGAVVQLRVEDCYNSDGTPRSEITFRANTRKAAPDGKRQTRQVPVHPVLFESLGAYKPEPDSIWMFPNREAAGPITVRWADKILRAAVERAGLEAKGISTHSTRRTFITKLHRNGTDLYTIQKITGHRDLKALGRYVEIDSDRVKGAIATL